MFHLIYSAQIFYTVFKNINLEANKNKAEANVKNRNGSSSANSNVKLKLTKLICKEYKTVSVHIQSVFEAVGIKLLVVV